MNVPTISVQTYIAAASKDCHKYICIVHLLLVGYDRLQFMAFHYCSLVIVCRWWDCDGHRHTEWVASNSINIYKPEKCIVELRQELLVLFYKQSHKM